MLTADIVAAPTTLCVAVLPLQPTVARGNPAQWAVAAWTTGGAVTGATIHLGIAPAGGGTPTFSLGCAADDGTSTCDLGTVNPDSAALQFRARATVPLAATVSAVTLTASVSATGFATGPAAPGTITVVAPGTPAASATTQPAQSSPGGSPADPTYPAYSATAPVSLADPTFPPYSATTPAPTLAPGNYAGDLFPSVSPSSPLASGTGGTRSVANTTTASTGGGFTLAPELVGLVALALAFILAFTRVSLRRPAPRASAGTAPPPAAAPPAAAEPAQGTPEVPGEPERRSTPEG